MEYEKCYVFHLKVPGRPKNARQRIMDYTLLGVYEGKLTRMPGKLSRLASMYVPLADDTIR
jgi:hypothetical protein